MVQIFYYYRGGDSTYMLNLTKLLEEKGHEVIPFAMQTPQNLPSPYSDYFVSEIDFPELLKEFSPSAALTVIRRSIFNAEARRKIARLIENVKPDIAHFHNIHGYLTTSIIKPLRKRGIPIIWTLHDYRLLCPNAGFLSGDQICERCLPNRFYEVLIHRCKKGSFAASMIAMISMYYERLTRVSSHIQHYITPSRFLESKMIEGKFDTGRITTIPNFIDLEAYKPRAEKNYFLYFGRLLFAKGLDLLIHSIAALDEGELWIVGEGPEEDRLRELASELGTDRVKFVGYLSGEELKRTLAECQFVVLPSRWYENLPYSIMEAFAAGKAVVAPALGGIPEMVENGVNGCLFPFGDIPALTNCLKTLLNDPALRREMGRRGREKAERLYNRDLHYEKVMEVYRKALGGTE
jgi:glycosyltransferase involved in cell wall biosynthesis